MLVKELRAKGGAELLKLIDDLKAELFMLRFQNKTGQLDKPHKIAQVKKDIAKVFTIINARNLKIETQRGGAKPGATPSHGVAKVTTRSPKPRVKAKQAIKNKAAAAKGSK